MTASAVPDNSDAGAIADPDRPDLDASVQAGANAGTEFAEPEFTESELSQLDLAEPANDDDAEILTSGDATQILDTVAGSNSRDRVARAMLSPNAPRLSKSAMKAVERRMSRPVEPVATEVLSTLPEASTTTVRTQLSRLREQTTSLYARVRTMTPQAARAGQGAPSSGDWPLPGVALPGNAPLAALEARDVSAWFGDHQVLDRVSLTMPAGVVTSLIGPSGCGKSTFLRILNRMHELIPSATLAGEVMLDGDDIYDADRRLVDARKSIGMVFQKPNPFPAMSIYDNVIAGLKLTGIKADRDRRDYLVESSLTKAGLWREVRDRLRAPGGGLSGGQQQRLCIARSLAVAPRVLLMDEPCSALDPTSTRVIEETMLELANEVTIVIVTHNMQQAQRVSTQCAFFLAAQGKPGGIVEHGSTEAMFSEPIDSRTFDYVNGRFG